MVSVLGRDERRAGSVAEQRTYAPVQRVDVLRIGLRHHEERARRDPALDEATHDGKPIRVPGAAQVVVECRGGRRETQSILEDAGGRGQEVVGTLSTEDQEIDRAPVDTGAVQQLRRRDEREVPGGLLERRDVPFADPRLLEDLLRRPGGEDLCQLGVGDDALRQVMFQRADDGPPRAGSPCAHRSE